MMFVRMIMTGYGIITIIIVVMVLGRGLFYSLTLILPSRTCADVPPIRGSLSSSYVSPVFFLCFF